MHCDNLSQNFEIVGTATDGRALLEAAEIRRPDLVITDISMPVIDGIGVTRRLRELFPDVRVLVLSIHILATASGSTGSTPGTQPMTESTE